MTSNSESQEVPEKEYRLLSPEEQTVISQKAAKEPPFSRRAQALLAVDDGATQAEAGRLAGLTVGQVRYWVAKFRRDGTNIFPEEMLDQPPEVDVESPKSLAIHADSQDSPDSEDIAEPLDSELAKNPDMPRVKKGSRKAKKSIETKKDKKAMKGKKSKKKTKKAAETKKPKKDKIAMKGKKSQKKSKKDTPQKKKSKKGDSKRKKSKK